jgi:hypothetical protein
MPKHHLYGLVLAVALRTATASGAEGNAEVTAAPIPPAEERRFDPWKPPGSEADAGRPGDLPGPPVDNDGKPLIRPPQTACSVYDFAAQETSFDFEGDPRSRVTITSVNVTLGGTIVIHLPANARRQLIEHERGHDVLARYAYGRIAEREFSRALRGFVGRSYLPRPGKSAKQVAEEVFYRRLAKASSEIQTRIDALSDEFDRLTQHGRSRRVDTKRGIEQAKEWFEKGPPHGKRRRGPAPGDSG